jgi:hypothetical protein
MEAIVNKIYDTINLEYIDIVTPEELETEESKPHERINEWNKWNNGEESDKKEIISNWVKKIVPHNVLDSDNTTEVLDYIINHIKENRRNRLYNNIDYLKLVLDSVLDDHDKPIFKNLIQDETDIEIVRQELKGLLKNAYKYELSQGMNPDPLEYYDVVGDIRL